MAGTGTKRITELTEASTIQSGDFIAVDSNARGTKKVSTDTLATSAALTAETNARAGADEQMSERMDGIEEQTALIQNPTKTLSGALVSFTDGADMPMVACTASIVPKQSGTGTPSPDNVRAISGWESVNLYRSGKNLAFLNTLERNSYTSNGITWTYSNGVIHAEGTATATAQGALSRSWLTLFITPTLKAGTYTISKNSQDVAMRLGVGSTASYITVTTLNSYTYNLTSDNPLTVGLYVAEGVSVNTDIYLQIEADSTATDYAPYTGTTYITDLGRTVYGGTLDVVSGVLTVDRAIVDLGTLTWTYVSADFGFYANLPLSKDGETQGDTQAICSAYRRGDYPNDYVSGVFLVNDRNLSSAKRVWIKNDNYTDAAAFKTSLSGQTLVYTRATPQTYTLTGQEVSTLLGDNNVWADSGDVEITYRRDISIVLENLENALSGSNSLNTMMMSAPTENTAEEPTEDEAEDDMR